MAPKKKPAKVEPERIWKHPYIPCDAKELFGREILWIPQDQIVDYSTYPDDDDPSNNRYKKEYHGKIVVHEAIDDHPETFANDPIIVDDEGYSYYNVPKVVIVAQLETERALKRLERGEKKAMDEINELNDRLKNRNESIEELKQRLHDLSENYGELEASTNDEINQLKEANAHFQAKALEATARTKTPISMQELLGGEPKEVVVKW